MCSAAGNVSPDVERRVLEAPADELEHWTERIIVAQHLSEVFESQ